VNVLQVVNPSGALATKVCRKIPAPPQPRCGDSTVDPGEACDDGNDEGLDACSSDCKVSDPARVDLDIAFGLDSEIGIASAAHLRSGLPVAADASGCGAVDVTKDGAGIQIVATICDPATMDRVRFAARVPSVGPASVEAYASRGSAEEKLAPEALRVNITSISGRIQNDKGFRGSIDAGFRRPRNIIPSQEDGIGYVVKGTFEAVPR